MRNDNSDQVELAAIKAYAATTKTPFKTAFMATLGVAAAQLAISAAFFGGLFAVGTLVYLFVR